MKEQKKEKNPNKSDGGRVNEVSEKKKISPLNLVLTIIASIVGIILGRVMGIGFLAVLLVFVIGYFPGYWLGKWWAKKESGPKALNIAIWFNIFTWLLPILGIFVAGLCLAMTTELKLSGKKYQILGYAGLILSVINGVVGALINMM